MSRRIAGALLRLAARRWPIGVRAEMQREWLSELHVLDERGQRVAMMTYAASLAISRPPDRRHTVVELVTGAWPVLRLLVVAPILTLACLMASLAASLPLASLLAMVDDELQLQMPLVTAFTLGSAVLLAKLGRRWTLPGARLPLLLAVTVPGFAIAALGKYSSDGEAVRHLPGYVIFFVGLGVTLLVVRRFALAGHSRRAWWTGALGAIVAADLAVMPILFGAELPPAEDLHPAYAPVWLFTALTDSGFGLPHPTAMEIFTIGDLTELDPLLFIAYAGLALGAVCTTAVHRPGVHGVGARRAGRSPRRSASPRAQAE